MMIFERLQGVCRHSKISSSKKKEKKRNVKKFPCAEFFQLLTTTEKRIKIKIPDFSDSDGTECANGENTLEPFKLGNLAGNRQRENLK